MTPKYDEKEHTGPTQVLTADVEQSATGEELEVFKQTADGENYRTVSWHVAH